MKAFIFFAFIMWSCFYDLMAQQVTNVEIVGPSEVELEEIETYSINFYSGTNITYPSGGTGYQWTYEGATLLLDTYNRAELRFDTPGPQFVAYEFMTFDGNFYDYKEVRVNEKNPCADVTVSGIDASRFGEGSLTLVAEAAPPGFIYQWFDKDSTTLLGTYREFTTPVLTSTKTYYLAYKHLESGCITGQVPVSAFISDHNYVKKYKARVEQASEETIKSGSSELSYKDFTYFDGLGRPMQQVKKHASTTGKDIVTPMIYDEYGRPFKEYLPYSDMEGDAEGLYKKDALESHSDFYRMKHGDALGFHEKMFESSPLNRIEKQAAPGESWKMGSGKEIKFGRRPNSSEDDVRVFEVDSTGLPVSSATYEAGTLWVEVTDNEDDHRTMVFTDKLGRTVLKKVQHNASSEDEGHQGWLCTYYVYDVFGNLRVVIPPKAVTIMNTKGWAMSTDSTLAAGQYFMYKYDGAKRMIEKQVPGKAPEHFVYDKKDRLVASQDGELRAKGQWHYRKYDYLNREVVTGLAEISKSRSELQEELDSVEDQEDSVPDEDSGKVRTGRDIVSNKYEGHEKYLATHSITLQPGFRIIAAENISFSAVIDTTQTVSDGDFAGYDGNVLTLSYYDDYSRTPDGAFEKPEGYSDISRRTTGLLTGKKVKDLVTGAFYSTLYFYDEKARVIQTLEGHQLGGTLRTSTRYNFEDQPMASLIQFHDPETIDITRRYHYNRAGMLTGIGHKIGEGPEVVLASYSYDELGEKTETVFPEADGASHTFSYNIRGWLKHIGSPVPGLFNMTLDYQESDERWDGNIMKAEWKGKDGTDRNYHYSYDQPGRLTGADYEVPSTVSENSRYTLSGIDYDENGNLKAMARRGETTAGNFNLIDDLSYEYEEYSNRLSRVKDKDGATGYISKDFKPSADFGTYAYDANGNQTSNPDKQISTIRYNHLNLPEEVVFSGGGKIWYDYDAEGRKRKQRVYQDGKLLSTTDYMGELVFRDGELDYLIHEEGRVAYDDGLMKYEFFLKDHLGNVRQVIRKPETQTVLATMEMAVAEEEEQHFEQLSASRQLGPEHNVTPGGNQVAWLNAERGRILGPARTQRIYQGEKIRLSVHGKYHNPNKKTVNPGSVAGWGMKSRLEKELLEFSASTTRSASPNAIAVLNIVHLMVTQLRRKDAPEAYMMYALYDADSILYDQGKQVLTKNAANKHEILERRVRKETVRWTVLGRGRLAGRAKICIFHGMGIWKPFW